MFQTDVFNLLFEAVIEGVIVVDDQHKIVANNTAAERIFGYDKGELLNNPISLLIPDDNREVHAKETQKFITQKESRQMGRGRDLHGKRKDGEVVPVEIGLNFFKVYDKDYVMSMIIDITHRKTQEQKLNELNASLEHKVKLRTKDLNTAVDDLKIANTALDEENKRRVLAEKNAKKALKKEKELNELKTKFLSLVSHEFKTPLSGILTSSMLLSKYKTTEQQENRDKHIKTIADKVHYLNNILNDFLSVEKLEKGRITYSPKSFKLSKVINEVVYNANMLLKEGQHIIYPENIDDISLYQDEKIVELALNNVLHNAIKYSPENTTIHLIVQHDENEITFSIEDKGLGIPKKDQKKIFSRYFRADNVINTQGTGIGLNIVKTHLENLGGKIWFTSEENKGSTFNLTFPNQSKT